MSSRIRIIGGQWRSRQLTVPAVAGLRPTPDRVRETLFNWLGQDLSGQHCADLFAGTGILGFEAASRGAAAVVMVERNRNAAAALHKSAITLQAAQVEIICGDAVTFVRGTTRQFDGVFVDPPFGQGWIERIIPELERVVRPGGWVYVEAESAVAAPERWQAVKRGRAGSVHFQLWRRSTT